MSINNEITTRGLNLVSRLYRADGLSLGISSLAYLSNFPKMDLLNWVQDCELGFETAKLGSRLTASLRQDSKLGFNTLNFVLRLLTFVRDCKLGL